MTEIKSNELMEDILNCARKVSDGINELRALSDEAGQKAGIYSEKIAVTAASLRNDACVHMNDLIDDMEKAVKITL